MRIEVVEEEHLTPDAAIAELTAFLAKNTAAAPGSAGTLTAGTAYQLASVQCSLEGRPPPPPPVETVETTVEGTEQNDPHPWGEGDGGAGDWPVSEPADVTMTDANTEGASAPLAEEETDKTEEKQKKKKKESKEKKAKKKSKEKKKKSKDE
jgi:hypothetical protein